MTACEGDMVTLPCTTSLPASVDWRYHSSPFDDPPLVYSNYKLYDQFSARFRVNNGSHGGDYGLSIAGVRLNDTGLYTCQEDGGLAVKHTIALLVKRENQ